MSATDNPGGCQYYGGESSKINCLFNLRFKA